MKRALDTAGLKPAGERGFAGVVAKIPLDHIEPVPACQGQQLIVITALGRVAPQALVVLHGPQKILKGFTTHRLDQPNSARCST